MHISLESDDVFARALPNLPGGPFISPARDRSDRRGARQAHTCSCCDRVLFKIYIDDNSTTQS